MNPDDNPALEETKAVQNGEVYIIQNEMLWSPRHVVALTTKAKWFHPGLFVDLNRQTVHYQYLDTLNIDYDFDESGIFYWWGVVNKDWGGYGSTEGEYTEVNSAVSVKIHGVWHKTREEWEYDCYLCGGGAIRKDPDEPKREGWGCFKHHLTINEIYNMENFYFNHCENCPDHKKVWCSGEKLPHIKYELSSNEGLTCIASYPSENSVWNIINPGNRPSDAGFSYEWTVEMNQNQTIVFDMNLDFINIENTRNTEKTDHNWRVIITSTPDPEKLSLEQMKEYGISGYEATHHISFNDDAYSEMTCSYTRNSGDILVKQEFIKAMAGD